MPHTLDWLRELRDEWYLQDTEQFGYGIVPDLDLYLVNEERRQTLLNVFGRVMARMDALGDPLTAETLNSLGVTGEKSMFTGDDVRGIVRDTAKKFVALVSGEPVHHIGCPPTGCVGNLSTLDRSPTPSRLPRPGLNLLRHTASHPAGP